MLNSVVIMGRLTAAPELKSTSSGTHVTSFAIAVERSYKGANDERQTDFIDCVAWRNNAEFITRYFQKGSMIAVTGSIQTRTYDDKNGNKRKATEVLVNEVSFTGEKKSTSANTNINNHKDASDNAPDADSDFEIIVDDEDLPF